MVEDSLKKDLSKIKDEAVYTYMGKQESGNYVYFGFKENRGRGIHIMRKDITDDSAWAHYYAGDGWTSAWADPTTLSYSDPPNE